MIFSSKARPRWQRAAAGLFGALVLAVVAACGGSTTQYELFIPQRLLVFGDETSLIAGDGRKYGVNALDILSGTLDCQSNPIWVQRVAALYGFVFAECSAGSLSEPQAFMYAAAGAKVADIAAQVESRVAAGGFRDGDLVLVLAGANDLLELYHDYPVRPEAGLLADAGGRGAELARVVNRLVTLGARVIVSNVPDMGLSPYAFSERAVHTDIDRAALISRLAQAFNDQLGVTVLLDGRFVGLMQTDLRIQAALRSPASFGFTNVTEGVCTVDLPLCTSGTLVEGAVPEGYLWADATRLGLGGHGILASLAISRATRNPF